MQTLTHHCEVDGIHLQVTPHESNPAQEGVGHPDLLDGYVEIITVSDGTNPFYPNEGIWRTLLVQIRPGTSYQFEGVDNDIIFPVFPTDRLDEIMMVEDSLQLDDGDKESFGLWQIIRFTRPQVGELNAVVLCQSLGDLASTQFRQGGN